MAAGQCPDHLMMTSKASLEPLKECVRIEEANYPCKVRSIVSYQVHVGSLPGFWVDECICPSLRVFKSQYYLRNDQNVQVGSVLCRDHTPRIESG